jgi:hypothetical protein
MKHHATRQFVAPSHCQWIEVSTAGSAKQARRHHGDIFLRYLLLFSSDGALGKHDPLQVLKFVSSSSVLWL